MLSVVLKCLCSKLQVRVKLFSQYNRLKENILHCFSAYEMNVTGTNRELDSKGEKAYSLSKDFLLLFIYRSLGKKKDKSVHCISL